MKKCTLLILSLLLFLLTACDLLSNDGLNAEEEIAAIDANIGEITEIECPLKVAGEKEGETYSCGVYTAPVIYDDPEAGSINLAFMVLHAHSENALPDPIAYLAGGPGQSGIVSAGGGIYGDLREKRDLIFPAQRGTLFSRRLALEECVNLLGEQIGRSELNKFTDSVGEGDRVDRSLPYDAYLAQYSEKTGAINARCHEAFATAGLDPTQFNSANSANDLIGLLTALGYGSFNLHGTSYGTKLALETIRRHPDANIRSVVLDSPVAPTEDRLANMAVSRHDMVLQLFEDCAAEEDCSAAYPDLTDRTAALLEELTNQPLNAGELTVGAGEVIAQLSDLTNTRGNYIPRMIAELEAGETATYLALLNGEVGADLPEGSTTSQSIDILLRQVSMAAATSDDPFAGLQVVADLLSATQEENPREAMKVVAGDSLGDAEELPQILNSIDELSNDDLETLAAMMSEGVQEDSGGDKEDAQIRSQAIAKNNAHFLQVGITCLEHYAYEDVPAALAARDNLAIPGLATSDVLLATEVGNCTGYPMGAPDPSYYDPVTSDIPTLILQGEFDVRTPPANGRALAEQLTNATLAIVPQAGHETWGDGRCVSQMGIEFILNPEQTPDLSCLELRQESFSLPGDPLTATTIPQATAELNEISQAKSSVKVSKVEVGAEMSDPVRDSSENGSERALEGGTMAELAGILGNLSYSGLFPDQQIALTAGYAAYDDEGSGHPFVRLIDHFIPSGDLNGDGTEDTVVLLVDYTTGSADFVWLAAVLSVWAEPTPLEAIMIGDRTPVKSLAIKDAQVITEFIGPGPSDATCCPTLKVHKVYALEDGRLAERSSAELGTVSPADLNDTSWVLANLDPGQQFVPFENSRD